MSAPEDAVHIDAPELMTAPERTRDTLFTAIMWLVYLYLWVPLASLLAWLLGFEFAYDVMIRSGGARDLGAVLTVYGVIVVVIAATVAFWSLGNRFRYGNLKRRAAHSTVTTTELARYFDVDPAQVERLRAAKLAAISFDADGRPQIAYD